jgi:SAM-dependent methyltransferase
MSDAAAEWSGEKGRFWAEHADWFSRLLSDFGEVVVEGAELATGDRVLDVGCGGGDVAMAAAAAVGPDGTVLGVDLSADELDVARVRAAQRGIENVAFREADASADDLGPDRHDVLTSRFGVMFFADPVAAFTHLGGALRPGGRLAFVCWQSLDANEWTTVPRRAIDAVLPLAPPPPPDTPGGFAFGDPDRVRSVLEGAGWTGVELTDVERTVHLGTSIDEAVAFVRQMDYAKAVLDPAPPAQAAEAVDRVRAALATRAGADGAIDLPGRVWLVRART